MKRLLFIAVAAMLAVPSGIFAVEYGGEKTYLKEIPYKVCPVAPLPEEAKKKGITVVSTDKAAELYKKGAYFYDARRKAHYKEGHVKGAFPVLFDDSKASYTVLSLPKDPKTPLVFYCYGLTCANSYEAALAVKEIGYENVYWYSAGYVAWHDAKLPVAK